MFEIIALIVIILWIINLNDLKGSTMAKRINRPEQELERINNLVRASNEDNETK